MRTSKYLNQTFVTAEGTWTVTHIGIATVQGARAKYAYHRGYYYLVERMTSDGKCDKQVRLNSAYMAKFARGEFDIEAYADRLQAKKNKKATSKVNYSFI